MAPARERRGFSLRMTRINHEPESWPAAGAHRLTLEQKRNIVPPMFSVREAPMLKVFVEEAAALASITLFVGMVALWAQIIPQL
ncbi:hypothetical protein [Bradyrhizobium sp. SZCCHNR1075]|uniref:hypothetical protein n=1 Tax=Bradyrhizobium sp. SZCCHNR1075 TaxID=3057362 RepID=UPI0028E37FDA|nr:hypothetical protein [Bradyrhizobium sp. SZCCHNR1075]